jgi:ferredoxin
MECIDCDACVSECPVEAIYPDDEVPEKWEDYIDINERLSEAWEDRIINETQDALPDADEWASKEDKKDDLVEAW